MSCGIETQRKDVSNQLLYIMFHDEAQHLAAFNGKKCWGVLPGHCRIPVIMYLHLFTVKLKQTYVIAVCAVTPGHNRMNSWTVHP